MLIPVLIYVVGPTVATVLVAGLVFLTCVAVDAVAGRMP